MSSFVPFTARRRASILALALLALTGCSYSGPTSTFEELGSEANTKDFGDLYPPDNREPGEFTALTEDSDEGFRREKFLYGVRARYRLAYGYWQHAVRTDFVLPT